MRRLLHTEDIGGRIERWYMTSGIDGEGIAIETEQDVEPIMDDVKVRAETERHKDMRYAGSIPATVIEEVCRATALRWGVKFIEAYREIVMARTDRAQRIWAMLLKSRDYRKFQAG